MRLLYEPLTDIPIGFKEVEYLESTGTQWIDTGINVDTSTDEIKLYFQLTDTANYKWLFGEYDTNARIGLGSGDGTNLRNFLYQQSATKVSDTQMYGKQHLFEINSNGGFLDGTKIRDYLSFASTATIYLFNLNIDSASDYRCKSKIWGYRHTRNGVLVRDLVPVLDKNNLPCLWDKVEGKAYYNLGTGDFTYGRQIIPVEYLESTGTQYIDTGYKANSNTKVDIDFTLSSHENGVLFGGRTTAEYDSFFVWSEVSAINCCRFDYTYRVANNRNGALVQLDTKSNIVKDKEKNYLDGIQYQSNSVQTFQTAHNAYLFAGNNSGTANYFHKGKIFSAKIYDNDNLIRNYLPAIDENGVGYMFDKATHTICDNVGTGSFLSGPVKKKKKLRLIYDWNNRVPRGFKEVEYIQSSGTQYIDTGFIPTGNTGIDMRFLITGRGAGSDSNIIMSGGDSAGYRCGFGYRSSSTTSYGHTLQISGICATGVTWENYGMTANIPHTVLYNYDNQKKCYLDGVLKRENIPYGTATVTYPLFIFSSNMNGASWRAGEFKLYYCKIVDNGVLVRDFIPCLDSNNVPCLWDTVTKQAYYNQGTGDFTYGSQIIPVKYLESTGTQYIDTGLQSLDVNTVFESEFAVRNIPSGNDLYGADSILTGCQNGKVVFTNIPIVADTFYKTKLVYNVGQQRQIYVNGEFVATASNYHVVYPIRLFGLGGSGVTQTIGSFVIKETKITLDGVLQRYFIPVKDENGVGYMFDTLSHSLYANAGTGSFVVGEQPKNTIRLIEDEIPSIYQRVNYLKASGQQYIDTGIGAKSGVRTEIGFEWGSEDIGNDKYVLAAAHPSYGRIYFGTYQSKWMYGYGAYVQAGTPVANTYYKGEVSWEKGNQYMKVNNESLYTGTSTTSVDTGYTLYMFARNQDNPGWYSYAKIYYCKMWENGVLVRSYVPVVRKSDNKPGMYDRVTKQFYTNQRAGVSDFTWG